MHPVWRRYFHTITPLSAPTHCGCGANIANHLIHEGFTADGAKKAASVFKANAEYAKLAEWQFKLEPSDNITQVAPVDETPAPGKVAEAKALLDFLSGAPKTPTAAAVTTSGTTKQVLAKYSIPLGENEAEIIFTGAELHPEDFDALADYVALFKKQHLRKMQADEIKKKLDAVLPEPPKE